MRIIKFKVSKNLLEICVSLLEQFPILSVSWYEDVNSNLSKEKDESGFFIHSFFWFEILVNLKDFPLEQFKEVFGDFFNNFHCNSTENLSDNVKFEILEIPKYTQDNFKAIIGKFKINCGNNTRNKINIKAGLAFGSGEHQTTKGCILALNFLSKKISPKKILDLGCGSGILGVVAYKLWSNSCVFASDIDPISVKVTKENSKINKTRLNVFESVGFKNPKLQKDYDLIIANILANPLKMLACDMKKFSKLVILSGILKRQSNSVINVYRSLGFFLEKEIVVDSWSTLILKSKLYSI